MHAMRKPHDHPPRKVIVATSIFPHYGAWNGLERRLETLCDMIDRKVEISRETYGRGTDLILFTEHAVTGGSGTTAAEKAHPLDGKILDTLAAKARTHNTNLCVPMHLDEDRDAGIFTNSVIILNRRGDVAGIYRKIHPVNGYACVGQDPQVLESGITPGKTATPVELDVGRVGVQICWDMCYDDGWELLAQNGAELVLWATAAPRTLTPAMRAVQNRYWIVTATPRDNASIFEPATGQPLAQVHPPATMLVEQIDLSWLYLFWSPDLKNGKAFTDAFGEKVGYHYIAQEDCGLFWSNDPNRTIGDMCREIGIDPDYNRVAHAGCLAENARGKPVHWHTHPACEPAPAPARA